MLIVKLEEAVLRELNLYPLWKRRGEAAPDAVQHLPPARGKDGMGVGQQESLASTPSPALMEPLAIRLSPQADKSLVIPLQGGGGLGELGWPELKAMVSECTACGLRAGCTQSVFGVGDEKAGWLFVGEGPGADEDAQGEPFVGQAGKLLDNMLAAIKLKRGRNVYIANIVKCRPPGNRTPEAEEVATCLPYLQRQIELIQPRIIVALGKTAAASLLKRDATLASLRGKLHTYRSKSSAGEAQDIPLVITYHPAYLLRTPSDKAKAWQDLCLAVETVSSLEQEPKRGAD